MLSGRSSVSQSHVKRDNRSWNRKQNLTGLSAKILMAAGLLALSACATGGQQREWIHTKSGATNEDYSAALDECKTYADFRAYGSPNLGYGSGGPSLIGIFAVAVLKGAVQGSRHSQFQSLCLEKLGYRRTLVTEAQSKRFNSLPNDEAKKAFVINFIDDAGRSPEKYIYIDEPYVDPRVKGLPDALPPSTPLADRNWVYAQFGVTSSTVQQEEIRCRGARQNSAQTKVAKVKVAPEAFWSAVHTCMLDAGYGRARLNKDQMAELTSISSAYGRTRFLLGITDDAGKDPGKYVFDQGDLDILAKR